MQILQFAELVFDEILQESDFDTSWENLLASAHIYVDGMHYDQSTKKKHHEHLEKIEAEGYIPNKCQTFTKKEVI